LPPESLNIAFGNPIYALYEKQPALFRRPENI